MTRIDNVAASQLAKPNKQCVLWTRSPADHEGGRTAQSAMTPDRAYHTATSDDDDDDDTIFIHTLHQYALKYPAAHPFDVLKWRRF